jgi:[protein-PII] uridylyltransferase
MAPFFQLPKADPIQETVLEILAGMRQTLARHRQEKQPCESPWEFLRRYTSVLDELVRQLITELHLSGPVSRMALVAVGGYGRRELTPWSDIDLMFLCPETSSQEVTQTIYRILHALWDLHLEIGHSVRTIEDCVRVSRRDVPTWTALMDARFLVGDERLFRDFRVRIHEELLAAEQEPFIDLLIRAVAERHSKYSRTPFLIEPHLKEGPGGLRDLQSARWLARCRFAADNLDDLVAHALISMEEADEIREAHTFLWRVRLTLHRLADRKEDQLTFALQERLAQQLAEAEGRDLRVEDFMRDFYRHATRVRYFLEDIIHKATDPSLASGPGGPTFFPAELGEGFLVVRGRLTLLDEQVFKVDPPRIMEAIAFAAREGFDLDIFTRDEIKHSLNLVDKDFRCSARVQEAFFALLETPDCGHGALELMHRLGLLQAYIPEFQAICFQVQHDAYHAYTVDFHSLEAVGELAAIRKKAAARGRDVSGQAANSVKSWPLLVLAVLLHDIGKGRGYGHAERGAELAHRVLDRWSLTSEERGHVLFLVREHILLMDTALGRDLTEEKVIADLGRTVGAIDRLNDLYCLTLADLQATGPDVLTEWKDQLLRELYLKTARLLETGELVSPEASLKIEEAKDLIMDALQNVIDQSTLDKWVQSLPGRYLLTTPAEDLVGQVLMAWRMVQADETLRLDHRRRNGYWELVICTRDAPALFTRICGVLVAYGFNILGARIHTWTNGIVMDALQVESLGAENAIDAGHLEKVHEDLAAVLKGKKDLNRLLARRAPSSLTSRRHPRLQPRVRIDNRSSDFYTIVEVRARDRFGLLFVVTRALSQLDLNIDLALIDTRRGQVFDAFYVRESAGQKVWEDARLAALERALYRTLERLDEVEDVGELDDRDTG